MPILVGRPVSQPTSCCFGGPDLTTLFITTARAGLSPDDLRPRLWIDGALTFRSISPRVASELFSLAPFGAAALAIIRARGSNHEQSTGVTVRATTSELPMNVPKLEVAKSSV